MTYLPEAQSFNFVCFGTSGVERFVDSSPLKRKVFKKGKRQGTKQPSSWTSVMSMGADYLKKSGL